MKIIVAFLLLSITQLAGARTIVQMGHKKIAISKELQAIIANRLGKIMEVPLSRLANDRAEGITIGIDLGTTNSAVTMIDGEDIVTIISKNGASTTPSVVSFKEGNEIAVGEEAFNQMVLNPQTTIFSAKRFIGKKFQEIRDIAKEVPYEVTKDSDGNAVFKVNDKEFAPHEVSGLILRHLKDLAEAQVGKKIAAAVITVPAYFGDNELEATKLAGQVAGLTVRRLIKEPTAAALAYKVQGDTDKNIVVYDLGGGTFDVTVLNVTSETDDKMFEVIGTAGDATLGGDNFDEQLASHILKKVQDTSGVDVSDNLQVMNMIRSEARKAKEALSSTESYNLILPFLPGGVSVNETIWREDFEKLIDGFVETTKELTAGLLEEINIAIDEVDEVLLVGGSTRIPAVRKMLEALFKKSPNHSVNPDQAVSQGAAIQAANLSGDLDASHGDILLVDVNPIALGTALKDGTFSEIIPKQEPIPVKKAQTYTTSEDNQTKVDIKVLQGGRAMADDNKLIGEFVLDGIPMAKQGKPQIEVTFDIDADGTLSVSAKDLATDKEQKVTIESSKYKVSDVEIDRMREDLEKFKETDAEVLRLVELKNKVTNFIAEGKKLVDEQGDKIASASKEELTALVAQAERDLGSDELARIQEVHTKLEEKIHEISDKLSSTDKK